MFAFSAMNRRSWLDRSAFVLLYGVAVSRMTLASQLRI